MSELLSVIRIAVALMGTVEVEHGWASQYETDRLMLDTVRARQIWGHVPTPLPETDGFVAVSNCSRLGDIVWLYRRGIGLESFLVADCAGGHQPTVDWMREDNILVEIDHQTAIRWGVVGQGGVDVVEFKGVANGEQNDPLSDSDPVVDPAPVAMGVIKAERELSRVRGDQERKRQGLPGRRR